MITSIFLLLQQLYTSMFIRFDIVDFAKDKKNGRVMTAGENRFSACLVDPNGI